MKRYKLTKGSLSRIRTTEKGRDELIEEGYTFDGEVDENLKPIGITGGKIVKAEPKEEQVKEQQEKPKKPRKKAAE